jgi:iron complex outermembrane receptor protein
MISKRFCVSNLFYVMMGLAGIATPFVDAIGADHAAAAQAAGDDEGEKQAAGEVEASTQTKVVVSRKQIEEGQQEGYGEAVKTVAGVASNNGAGSANDSVKFRGIQLGLYTNYRINGGLAITNVITIPTEDKEKVEALKGANALMFGLASPAGIINLITKRPAAHNVSSVTVSGNAFGQYGAAVDLSRRFGDEKQFGLRVNASETHIATGVDTLSGTGEFGSISADWRATKKLAFKFDYENYRKDVMEQGSIAPLAAVNGVIVVPKTVDPTRMLGVTWGFYTPSTVNQILRADYLLSDNWKVLAEIGSSNSERSRVQARTTGNYNVNTGAGTMQIQWIKNQHYDNSFGRVELNGKFDLASIKNDAAFGYSSSERKGNNPFGFGSVTTPINIYNPSPIPVLADPNKPISYAPSKNVENSVYFYDTVGLTPTLKVLAGVRKSDAQFTSTNQKTFVQNTLKSSPTAPGAGLLWEFAPRTVLYGSYMRALEDGPTATAGSTNEFQILAPTESTQKEIGVRTDYFKGFYANVDYFDINRANAVTSSVPGAHFNEFMYDGTSHLRGFEIAANASINRAWSVHGTAQLMRGTQQTVLDPNLNGKTPENLAEVIGTLGVEYRVQKLAGLTLKASSSYTGPRFINALNQGKIPGVALFNAGASYQTKWQGHKTNFQVNVINLANKWYWNSVTSSAYGAGMERAIRFNAKIEY